MSEKGFGDQINRSVVKNPLLSNAVVGLSIEDLTHNAVLLPAVPSQEPIPRSDKQHGPQTTSLININQKPANFPSGDANSNIITQSNTSTISLNTHKDSQNNELQEIGLTQSKASVKSDDDFDVNEYFARLQGTRYVSAPLNRKEDQNANLAAEENLEEINLNEPEREEKEEIHSITADIAQNFSQLPTVLPQVASAVFSSFSNMLSMKSREQTPDYRPEEVKPMTSEVLSVPDVPKSIAPPPVREPPITGGSNYRITTKKKVYAQIPGLTGDYQPASQNAPYFNQPSIAKSEPITNTHKDQFAIPAIHYTTPNYFTPDQTTHIHVAEASQDCQNQDIQPIPKSLENLSSYVFAPEAPIGNNAVKETIASNNVVDARVETNLAPVPAPIIPPPPMFSNRRDSQGSVGRSVLPPSVARRLAANQPLLKPSAPPPTIHGNIFVPTFFETSPYDVNATVPQTLDTPKSNQTVFDTSAQSISTHNVPFDVSTIRATVSTSSSTTEASEPPVTDFLFPKSNEASNITKLDHVPMFKSPDSVSRQNAPFDITPTITTAGLESNNTEPLPSSSDFLMPKDIIPDVKENTYYSESLANIPAPVTFPSFDTTLPTISTLPPQEPLQSYSQPPLFFNPTTKSEITKPPAVQATSEPPKTVLEPPKLTGNLNYRMNKKRPQYYSGPIEGVGSISNNVKPIINPVQHEVFQGALFTPSQIENSSALPDLSTFETAAPIFDTSAPSFDVTQSVYTAPDEKACGYPIAPPQTEFSTAFDLSRPTTDHYDYIQTEARGFGLLGSLKSKLSAIDINKIQNSVTTFFDPTYNEAKEKQNESKSYGHGNDSTFDIFVGSSNVPQPHSGYPSELNTPPISGQGYYGNIEQQYTNYTWPAQAPGYQDLTIHSSVCTDNGSGLNSIPIYTATPDLQTAQVAQTMPAPTNAPTETSKNLVFAGELTTKEASRINNDNLVPVPKVNNPLSFFSTQLPKSDILDDKIVESVTNLVLEPSPQPDANEIHRVPTDTIGQSFNTPIENTFKLFDSHPLLPSDQSVVSETTFIVKDDIDPDMYEERFIEKPIPEGVSNLDTFSVTNKDNLFKYFEQPVTSTHLFDFPSLPPVSSEIDSVEKKVEDLALHEPVTSRPNEDLTENVSELNICVTCREVNKHEDKGEIEDLTTQLIENITAPIQLLNPVGTVAADERVPDISSQSTEQLEDITHITEDLIENIPIHSVTELLGDSIENTMTNYGWTADINDILNSPLSEQNYNLPDGSSIGFFQTKSLFDNMTNASDEIKAEFKNSHEELMPPLSLPTAPPEEDNKSDESGLDVHSIEQDATKDFPYYDEFVIEPSETDDDKIEFMEREKTSEEHEVDTFTNRVERYKKMETVDDDIEKTETVSTSPSLPMASYFDTGNYAVENHYRNSLTSPPSFAGTDVATRIPPGFEKEFSKRFPCVTSTRFSPEEHITYVPDTQTQTRLSPILTYSQSPTTLTESPVTSDVKPSAIETILTKPIEAIMPDADRLPAFSSLTESKEQLPDPKNFFATEPDKEEYNFSRLSSYFTAPQTENAKSFFELSQSQDHYRHVDTSETETHKSERYNNNMKLIRDLATYKDIAPKDIVRTVNYFTVEYDKASVGEPIASVKISDKDVDRIDSMPVDKVRKCKNCCDVSKGCVKRVELDYSNLKIKRYMDSGEEKKGEMNAENSEGRRQNVTVNFMENSLREEDDGVAILTENRNTTEYAPVKYHWFYRVDKDGQSTWRGFSVADSRALENAFNSPELDEHTLVPTDGGRYDVNVEGRLRMPVYWSEKPTNVRRCSWFYCNTDGRYVPYTEPVAEKLEEEYQHGITTGEWHRRLFLPNGELVVMHGPAVMVHFLQNSVDSFSGSPQSMSRPRVVKRGGVESEIEDTEPSSIDHLLLLCHGVGSACDMRMRPVEAVVDDFRKTSMQLLQSHYKNSYDSGLIGRIEVLPISWHSSLHSGETGVDKRLSNVTLDSIPWLRNFTNDTVLDVLFYTSPVFGQTIIDTVCRELNRIYCLFKQRNPDFKGGVSLGGHSLGSVILYDLLGHQISESSETKCSTEKTYVQECAGTGQPMFKYPKLEFSPEALFALGSPIAIFECVRGVEMLGRDFCLPTCKKFFNIFHPYDPIAYRLEPMINPELRDIKPYLIPHHKGRKRMHLELKDTMARVGADIKQKLIESIKSTWSSMWKTAPPPSDQLEKVVEEEMEKADLNDECKQDTAQDKEATPDMLGKLNGGQRIDYVLQEAPFEMINEYLFAMTSHVCYWESADTILLILREVYASMRVQPDCCVPQQTMTVQRTRVATPDGIFTAASLESPSTSRGSST